MSKNNKEKILKDVERRKKLIKTVGIWGIVIILLWITGMIISAVNPTVGGRLLSIESVLIIGGILLGIFIYICKRIKISIISKSIGLKFLVVFMLVSWLTIITGITMLFYLYQGKADGVNKVKVVDVKDGKILVDASEYYQGDYKVIEIDKPLFSNINKGDSINVRVKDNPEQMKCVGIIDFYGKINIEKASNILITGIIFLNLFITIDRFYFAIKYYE